jgi:hypothetical protein
MKLLVKILHERVDAFTDESRAFVDAIIGTMYLAKDNGDIVEVNVGVDIFHFVGVYSYNENEYEYSDIIPVRVDRNTLIMLLVTDRICSIECL